MMTSASSNERTSVQPFLVAQPLHLLQRHQPTTRWQHRNASAQCRPAPRPPDRSRETAARQLGQDPASRAAVAARQLLCGLENVICDSQSDAHTSEAIASHTPTQSMVHTGGSRDWLGDHEMRGSR